MAGFLRRLRYVPAFGGLFLIVSFVPARATLVRRDAPPVPYVDMHVDLPYQYNFKHAELHSGTGQFLAASATASGLCGVVFPLFVPFRVSAKGPRASDYESSWKHFEQGLSQQKVYARPGTEPKAGQVRTFYAFEGMGPFTDDREVLARWVDRGVRLFGLVHNQNNALAAAALDRRGADFGLTALGRRVVNQIYDLGGIVDVSHASDRATRDVLDIAEHLGKPVVASHSNARRLLDHPRNLSDELIDRIAKTGGLIGINFHSSFLVKGRRASLADVVSQINYVISRVGTEHVGIGSDFEGDIRPPVGLANLGEMQQLASALEAGGVADKDVKAIMGANALRLLTPR
jgi:membrane dipeptidase